MKIINGFFKRSAPLVVSLCAMLCFISMAKFYPRIFAAEINLLDEPQPKENLISLTLKDTDLREVLNILAFKGGVNIVAGEDVDTKVSVQLKDVHWEKALDIILRTYNYTYRKEGNLIRVMSLARALEEENKVPLTTRIVPLNFADVDKLKDSLSKILSRRGTIQVDKRTNSLIVTDIPEMAFKVEQAAIELDTETPQVLIEAMMVDIKLTEDDRWGSIVDLLDLKNDGNSFGTSMGASSGNNFIFSTTSDVLNLGGTLDFLVEQNRASILANPRVLTLDNQEAKIEIIEEIPYTEAVDTGGGTTINVKFKEAGVKLSVTPHITSGKYISMNVKPEQSFKSGDVSVPTGDQPIIDSRKAETNLLVRNGQTIVIGGLRQSKETIVHRKVPFLGDIPLLGLLFKKKTTDKVDTELVLFVTPHIIFGPELTDHEKEMFEKLDNTKRVVMDYRTEADKLRDFKNSMFPQKARAKKIEEQETAMRRAEAEKRPRRRKKIVVEKKEEVLPPPAVQPAPAAGENMTDLELDEWEFKKRLEAILSD